MQKLMKFQKSYLSIKALRSKGSSVVPFVKVREVQIGIPVKTTTDLKFNLKLSGEIRKCY